MARQLDRILAELLDRERGDVCRHSGEPVGPTDSVVVVMGSERNQPGAGTPGCRACSEQLRWFGELVLISLAGAKRAPSTL